jgi:SsrA-binding protein
MLFGMADLLTNSKARRDYHILETLEAGLVLHGTEVKSLRAGLGQIRDSYAQIQEGELFLMNAHIEEYAYGNRQNHQPKSARKLLVHKRELRHLEAHLAVKGHALVPLSCYWKNRKVKVLLGLGKGKAEFDKRADIRERDLDREMKRALMHRQRRH